MTLLCRRFAASSLLTTLALTLCAAAFGCHDPTTIDVDISGENPRFVIHHRTWGWPFLWPRVDAFALASEEDGRMWELEARLPEGVPARDLVFEYGKIPADFRQAFPPKDSRPRKLTGGRNYYIGATGPNEERYRMVFALPMPRSLDDAGFTKGIDRSGVERPHDDDSGFFPGIDRSPNTPLRR